MDTLGIPLQSATFLLKSHTEEFLNITDKANDWTFRRPIYSKKATQFLLKRCSQRVMDNFKTYYDRIDIPTFILYLKRHEIDIASFLLTKCSGCWLSFYTLKPFLDEIQQDRILNLLRNIFGIKHVIDNADNKRTEVEELFHEIETNNRTFSMVYRWYEFAPFEIAFKDLQKFIYAESSPEERQSMLIVLLFNARKNMDLVRTVLQYYYDKHINSPYIYKIQFVNSVLTYHDAFRFDDTTWNILNKMFHSLEVYIQSKNKVQQCLVTIMLHYILLGLPVHEIVEQKLNFNTLKDMKNKLNQNEQEIVFDYLHNQLITNLHTQNVYTESGMKEAVTLIKNIWTLIKDWNKEATHHQFVIDNIIKLSNLNKTLLWDIDMRYLYCLVKPFHKQLFENSLILYPCQEMCINALKHDPGLLVRHESAVTALCCKSNLSVRLLLSKLRIYWRESLANEWRNTFIDNLQNVDEHKSLVKAIFILSSQSSLLDLIKNHIPSGDKIIWSETNEVEISLQKHISKNLHIARPDLPSEVVLWFAKGDYLQYSLCSLESIYSNLRLRGIQKHIGALLNAPVSLKKSGIRLASARLKLEDLLITFESIWKSTKNLSIRNTLFQSVSEFLRKTDNTLVTETWRVLSFMIDDLNHKENVAIYMTLSSLYSVPVSVIGEYYQKCFLFLRDLPIRNDLKYLFKHVFEYATDIIEYLDTAFVENNILFEMYDIFAYQRHTSCRILSAYLLCSKDEVTQLQKFNNLFEPLFALCVPKWRNNKFDTNVIDTFQNMLTTSIANVLSKFVFEMKMIMPVKMLANIQSILESELDKEEHYGVMAHWKLFVAYIILLSEILTEQLDERNWENDREKSVKIYSELCLVSLKDDIKRFFPSIHMLFGHALKRTCDEFGIKDIMLLKLLHGMLNCNDVNVYLFVLNTLPNARYGWDDMAHKELDNIRRKLYSFPSKELKMHYFARYNQKYNTEECVLVIDDSETGTELK